MLIEKTYAIIVGFKYNVELYNGCKSKRWRQASTNGNWRVDEVGGSCK